MALASIDYQTQVPVSFGGRIPVWFWFVFALQFLAYFDRMALAGLAPAFAASLGLDDLAMGALLGPAFALPYALVAIAVALQGFGRNSHLGMLVGVAIWSVGSLSLAMVETATSAWLARALIGSGQAIFVPSALAALVATVRIDRRSVVTSLFTASSSLGRSTSLLLTGILLGLLVLWSPFPGQDEWRVLLVVAVVPNFVLMSLLWLKLPAPRASDATSPRAGLGLLARRWPFVAAFVTLAILPVFMIQSMAAWIPTLTVRQFDMPLAEAAASLGLATLLSAPVGQLVGGALLTRFIDRRRVPLVIAIGLLAATPCLAGVVLATEFALTLLALVCANLCLGVASFAALLGVQDVSPGAARRSTNSLFFAATTLFGLGGGPFLIGWLSQAVGTLAQALLITAAGCSAAALLLVPVVARRFAISTLWLTRRGEARV